jgi:5-dehydro-2-deoxygluconokinase
MTVSSHAHPRFYVLGRAGMDLYADPPGTSAEHAVQFTSALGGSAANIAAGLARLGASVSLISAISDDSVGRFVRHQLRHYGIDDRHVVTIKGEARTSLAVVETRAENCQSTIYRNNAADFALGDAEIAALPWKSGDQLIVTGTALAVEPSRGATFLALSCARAAGLATTIDIDYRPYSWPSATEAAKVLHKAATFCSTVIGNDEEFAVLAGPGGDGLAMAETLADKGARCVIYKMGSKGAISFADGERFKTGVFPVKALKPTGAGDAFMSGFMVARTAGATARDAVLRGSAAAALVVTRVGCAPAMPMPSELDEFLQGRLAGENGTPHAYSAP